MSEKPRVAIFYGGIPDSEDIKTLKSVTDSPHIVVGTPGRIKAVRLLFNASMPSVALTSCTRLTTQSLPGFVI